MANFLYKTLKRTFLSKGAESSFHQNTYMSHAESLPDELAIGGGDFTLIGRLELAALKLAGLTDSSQLLDLGCGIGRLAIHAVPYLKHGHYVGTDVVPRFISNARRLIKERNPDAQNNWQIEVSTDFSLASFPDNYFSHACAFSLFTHLDLEDVYRYLIALRRVIREDGKLVFTHLLLEENATAREVFLESASKPYEQRRGEVINIVSSRGMLDYVCQLAGWQQCTWYRHDEAAFYDEKTDLKHCMGQAVCILS